MTFFLMKNRFQQQQTGKEEDPSVAQPSPRQQRMGGNFLNALFGSSSSAAPERLPSQASEASSPSRASSASGRSHAYPPRRISFDEGDYGATREQNPGSATQPRHRSKNSAAEYADNRPEDHSSGTTDPPDEDPEEDFGGEDPGLVQRSQSRERGSDSSSGPDSPHEAVPGMDDDLVMFLRQFVEQIFQNSRVVEQEEKNQFGEFARLESGRLWFARFVNSQRINYSGRVDEGTFYRLVQYCAIVLFECYQEEDYAPAKLLMNVCFTFYKEVAQGAGHRIRREFLYHHLRKQAIWHSLKFWNAAYFDAMQADRARRSHSERQDMNSGSSHLERNQSQRLPDNKSTEGDYVYRTLVDFVTNMRAFHVAKESVIEFIRKQSHSINPDQFRLLRDQLDSMYG